MHERNTSKGFTLVELMIVVVLLAVFASIAMPSFTSLIENNRVQSAVADFTGLLQAARADAVAKRSDVTVSQAANKSWSAQQGGTTVRTVSFPASVTATPSATSIIFRQDGTASTNATVQLSSDRASTSYTVTVQVPGFIKNERDTPTSPPTESEDTP